MLLIKHSINAEGVCFIILVIILLPTTTTPPSEKRGIEPH